MLQRRYLLLGLVTLGATVIPALPLQPAQAQQSVELTLVSYAVAKPVFAKLIPAFQKEWKAKTGQTVTFKESYGASGAQTRAILAGLEADVLAQNLQTNVTPLVEKGLVKSNWEQRLPNKAVPAYSVMVLVTRPGNPKQIRNWSDLTKPGVDIIAINPKTSGNARWGVLAGYGSILKTQGQSAAQAYLNGFVRNIKTLVNSGREATDTFVKNRVGDVLLTFESEIIFTNEAIPQDFPYVAPSPNLQVDFPVTVIDRVVDKRGTRKVAEAFTKFLFSPTGQRIYAELGYRPYNQQVRNQFARQYKPVNKVFTIADLGGWTQLDQQIFADGGLFDRAQQAAAKR
ncbi:sulfate ABC transporter substrate-binding protein [Thermosynechococcaceae cyanobacterium BACA0444]|uniref:Sulfate ABC transporter substrate-binding protein n=1 Tax=Pseudocalidococcus azoricus BACA0444 TaxID=2918990 RepID=A0AAE4FW39_9CYAN|nr:sulfate ABC transporter substrate-binding protein [Pseudocalidococcus azoricus]MDS3862131.1 sulfate ABC transporter substrate-binding protein [Pseudocalidococcus azoricus BACA0444]